MAHYDDMWTFPETAAPDPMPEAPDPLDLLARWQSEVDSYANDPWLPVPKTPIERPDRRRPGPSPSRR